MKTKIKTDERGEISAGAAMIIIVIGVIIAAIVLLASAVTVQRGHVGVIDYFGVVDNEELSPELYFINPLKHVEKVNVQTQEYEYKQIRGTLTKEGIEIVPDTSIIWHLEPTKASDIYRAVKGDYFNTLITPAFMGILRDEMKKWTTEDFYTGTATKIQDDVYVRLKENLEPRGIVIEAVWFRGSELPSTVKTAIESKIRQKQAVEEKAFKVQEQRLEAERMLIEANASAQANNMLSKSITPVLVQWKYNEVLGKLADNKNNVFVISGSNAPQIIIPAKNE